MHRLGLRDPMVASYLIKAILIAMWFGNCFWLTACILQLNLIRLLSEQEPIGPRHLAKHEIIKNLVVRLQIHE